MDRVTTHFGLWSRFFFVAYHFGSKMMTFFHTHATSVCSWFFFVVVAISLLFNFARTKCEHVKWKKVEKKTERRCSMEKKKNVAERKGIGNNERVHAHSLTRLIFCSPVRFNAHSYVCWMWSQNVRWARARVCVWLYMCERIRFWVCLVYLVVAWFWQLKQVWANPNINKYKTKHWNTHAHTHSYIHTPTTTQINQPPPLLLPSPTAMQACMQW